jgi:hypothetical protein
MVGTLRGNGYEARHCHVLANIGMEPNDFIPSLSHYSTTHRDKLKIISVFREPIERHISSFFQWHGSKPLDRREVERETDTLIGKKSIHELQRRFITEIDSGTLVGIEESLDHICDLLGIDILDLEYSENSGLGVFEHRLCCLYLLRFDQLIQDFEGVLARVLATPGATIAPENLSSNKWYRGIYRDFRESLTLPFETVQRIYHSRRELFEVFFPGRFEALFAAALRRYAL